MHSATSVFGLLILVACGTLPVAESPQLTIHTQPSNATVQEVGGDVIGDAPVILTYDSQNLQSANGCVFVTGFVATWPNGAQAGTPPMLRLCDNHAGYQLTIDQSQGVVGVEADINYAERQRRVRQQQIQEDQQEEFFLENFGTQEHMIDINEHGPN